MSNQFTNAGALHHLLSEAAKCKKTDQRFLSEVARTLEINGEDADLYALERLFRLVKRIRRDIRSSDFADEKRDELEGFLAPFRVFESFSRASSTMKTANSDFLKMDNLNRLKTIDYALSGKVEYAEPPSDLNEVATCFRELRDEINNTSLPEKYKHRIIERTSQIANIIDKYRFFGADALEDELESLIGSLAIPGDAWKETDLSTRNKILTLCEGVINKVIYADQGIAAFQGLADKGQSLFRVIGQQ